MKSSSRKHTWQKTLLAAAIIPSLLFGSHAAWAAETPTAREVAQEAAGGYPSVEETIKTMQERRAQREGGHVAFDENVQRAVGEGRLLSKDEKQELATLREEFYSMSQRQAELLSLLDEVTLRLDSMNRKEVQRRQMVPGPTTANLVNPGPASRTNYTQDAINAQGKSMMTFSYAPNQLYKIYCRRGYITDLAFKKGEQLTYVGGGDTSSWAISKSTVDGTAHLYIKPIVETSTTNLIVATNKRSYQILLNSSDWYNPMVEWSYAEEDAQAAALAEQREQQLRTSPVNTTNVENLDFSYEVKGSGEYRPEMVFSDGQRVFLKFAKLPRHQVPLFVQEPGARTMTIVNYKQKDNYYIVDMPFEKAQLRIAERKSITITHKKTS